MRIFEWDQLSDAERRAALARPTQDSRAEIAAVARDVIEAVRRDGDVAVRSYTERFDGVRLETLAVSEEEFAQARGALTSAQLAALERALDNVHRFHSAQLPQPLSLETMPGVRCERVIRPISTVGLYVPAGSAPLPSAVVMLAVPARIAGCPQRILCTAPTREGRANPAVLVAARMCGIDRVFKVGGAQAIAALAYGTASIPKADKIFGPGNAWVTAAKQLVANDPGGAACDLPAGPSEVMVIADDTARADFVAADLLAQAEHDTQAQALLVTSSLVLARAVSDEVEKQAQQLSRRAILAKSLAASRCIVVSDDESALAVANEYAPEHLILQVREARGWLPRIQNAGSVFLGPWSPEPMGDYCSGTNHVLPTYGYARAYSGLSVLDFVRGMTVQELSPAGLRALGPVAVELANLEGLDAHASAVTRRLKVLELEPQSEAVAAARHQQDISTEAHLPGIAIARSSRSVS
jgi:histidinol dehydrogenase